MLLWEGTWRASFNHSLLACVQEPDKEEYERPGFSSFDFWSLSQSEHTTEMHKQLYEKLKRLLCRTRIEQEMTCDPRAQSIPDSPVSVKCYSLFLALLT